jgi:acid stress chaperone HdeB
MRRHVLVIGATLVSAATVPAVAQIRMDMNKITCKDLLGYSEADRTFVQYWMSGY